MTQQKLYRNNPDFRHIATKCIVAMTCQYTKCRGKDNVSCHLKKDDAIRIETVIA